MATFILIPGAGGAGWYWQLVQAQLVARGHDAVAVDLPADDAAAGLSAYADIVAGAAAGRGEVVLVAQSMGGFTAPLAWGRVQIAAAVFVNAMIPMPGERAGGVVGERRPAAGADRRRRGGRLQHRVRPRHLLFA